MTGLGREIGLAVDFDEALRRTTAALATQGFGMISRIDIDRAFAEKLGVAFRRFVVLGACNPQLAHAALSARPDVGLLLPCNVTVEENGPGAIVRIVHPRRTFAGFGLADSPELTPLAEEAGHRLDQVAQALSQPT
ncbi:MAG: DUF302 domain-containing protein [Sphingomonadaceae bacterium]|uniref:DUF302 domain-containing protein n=1 Tax=Thermaurantiacus sp. TaxID=2820283 RepID=UPI00298F12CE|nr:DUF302 domain-containing protein [Thermaurantiacus sp.]MCS6986063.1 DUF302 domain-containing protein [Sphingomonadaceae bacterium]MDW8414721.1 DUF302 domain-containing protein [Thermaurantiacus sp.]